LKTFRTDRIQLILFVCIFVYLLGAWMVPLMEIDAAQYANISREMLSNHHFLQVFDRGKDYLDKPPMLFWLSAMSMWIFGISDFAYRIPSILFALIAIYSTYKFCLLYYSREIAQLSALVLASCQALFLISHDVRTDTMLMGWVILSIWQLADWYMHGRWRSFFLAAFAIAGGMMTKGPIALMVPCFCFLPHFLLQRSFKQLFRWQYLLLLLIIGLLLIPMDIGLYQQFDLHPEKILYGQQKTSGLRFFYWTQSFGRITGESTWHENASFFFLFQNMLWSFLPWIIFFLIGFTAEIVRLFKQKLRITQQDEWISTGGFLLTYCALATSHYQLPHYIFVVFPLAAVVTGKFLFELLCSDNWLKWRTPLFVFHSIVFLLLFLALLALLYWPFQSISKWVVIAALIFLGLLIVMIIKGTLAQPNILLISVFTIIVLNIFLDAFIYPALLQYQQSIRVASIIRDQKLPKEHFFIYHTEQERSLQFYTNASFVQLDNEDSLQHGDYILTSAKQWDGMNKGLYRIIYCGEGFHVSTLSLNFLNPAKRKNEVAIYYILRKL
jgi:4-amino-4-deoxy-L-arabinose transferase-like glycosyltransferase